MTTVFGWLAGVSLGLLLNYVVFLFVGSGYPTVITTFLAFVGGAFGGMAVADRLDTQRGFRVLGIAAGVLLTLVLALGVAVLMTKMGA